MSIYYKILGNLQKDNALYVTIDRGNKVYRLLFDVGYGCIDSLKRGKIQSIDYLFFSHLHMDHVAGFDAFFRYVYNREDKVNMIFGPEKTCEIMTHRFQGCQWNLHEDKKIEWTVTDILEKKMVSKSFFLHEQFKKTHLGKTVDYSETILKTDDFEISVQIMDHIIPSIVYLVRERQQLSINKEKMNQMGLKNGPWLKTLKNSDNASDEIELDNKKWEVSELKKLLFLKEKSGDSIAYLTDFILDETAYQKLIPFLEGVDTVVCESQYLHKDLELARKSFHMTAKQAARLAKEAQVGKLILFHFSVRYSMKHLNEMLKEARTIFQDTYFPEEWLELDSTD